ncbi:zinc transporter ZntB [Parasalinivibrio latis]|uniref:zinc transporter ZntB n=1 Tax=Parasalinivibrio latis TaxID=2952610 RepID=UPI003DA1DC24
MDGLIHAIVLDGKGSGTWLHTEKEIKAWRADDGILWLHLFYDNHETRRWLENDSGLSDVVTDSLLADETRPRITSVSTGCLLSLRGFNANPEADPEDMVSIRLYIESNRVISTRKRQLLSVEDITSDLKKGQGPGSVSSLIAELMDSLTIRMQSVLDTLEMRLDKLEDAIDQGTNFSLREELSDIRRSTVAIRRYITPQKDTVAKISAGKFGWLNDDDRASLREVSNQLLLYIEELDMNIDRAQIAYEELNHKMNEQINQRMYRMSVFAAMFLPLSFLTGLFGVNVAGIPGEHDPLAFYMFLGFLVLISVLGFAFFRFRRWL